MSGTLVHICTSEKKGRAKTPVASASVIENHGLAGDAHAGPWHRQVSLLDCADIDSMRGQGLELKPGAFGENLGVAGIELDALGIGSVLAIGDMRLELTQIGKVCHRRCAIYYRAGDCIMPRAGLFARVLRGGRIEPGMEVGVERIVSRDTVQAAVLTVSDRCTRGETIDTSGPALVDLLTEHLDAHVAWTGIVPDDEREIAEALTDLAGRGIDLVLTTGGTGFAARDVTPEATRRVIEREAPGLAEEMRRRSAEITPHALLQRGVCGIRGCTLIANLPGSEKGARENLEFILPALPHAIRHLRNEPVHADQDRNRLADGAPTRG